ncbi:hypothetical protein QFC22_001908 [Naganishia vaughanmartiniae]|uniref:Uncharacterized protein n=1 Tax=Naganishia vaughanmartiniae TaxID=1424756 RepID=A0ACC2XFV1_9TREE|nr:hypothetical protein QFC22_001908 [Naganishia vaughanmartiniae]
MSSITDQVPTPSTASIKRARSSSPSAQDPERDAKRANLGEMQTDTKDTVETEKVESLSIETPVKKAVENGGSAPQPLLLRSRAISNPTPVSATSENASLPQTPSIATQQAAQNATEPPQDPATRTIQLRCLIVTQDASIIIGKSGRHVNEIREKANARVNVSESIAGNPERILSVSGPLDAVSKAFGLIVRRINDEPYDQPSLPGSRAVTIKFIIPNSRMGSVIGKGGSKIKEIQEASGARINASEAMLPGSTERILSVVGVADAIHIAVYYIGTVLLEYQDRTGVKDAMYNQRSTQDRSPVHNSMPPVGPDAAVQQFWIPNDLVGSIIGKGGVKINEIRTQSQCVIRVTDPGTPALPGGAANMHERLITIQGNPININIAVGLLHSRLEAEKLKKAGMMGGGGGQGMY